MKVYVASSWRNDCQPGVVAALRADGHDVYDFKDSEGFHWTEVDPDWKDWPGDIPKYLEGLKHPAAERGYTRDMTALANCDVCVYVMPCGVSASFEAGWAIGAGKQVVVYVPGLREPDLMVKMAQLVTDNFDEMRRFVRDARPDPGVAVLGALRDAIQQLPVYKMEGTFGGSPFGYVLVRRAEVHAAIAALDHSGPVRV